jgi:ring-1,2-phenylacetyl-CoA epoxidase subunit PaaC
LNELFQPHALEHRLPGVACESASLQQEVEEVLAQVLAAASLPVPAHSGDRPPGGGRDGVHTGTFPALLAVLQSLAREHPRGVW